jgi:hypothetical protein
MAGNSLLDRFRIFRRPIIVGACAITARRRSRAAIPIAGTAGARERRIRRGGGTGSSGLNERWTRRGKRRFIAVETLSKSGLSMGVPLVERLTSLLSNSLRRLRGLKPKDLVGIQWRVAFGQQDEGWCLRRDNV